MTECMMTKIIPAFICMSEENEFEVQVYPRDVVV